MLLFFEGVRGICYGVGLVKLVILLFVGMSADSTRGYFLKLVPIVNDLIAAGPALFGVVKNGLTPMIVTGGVRVFFFFVVLETARMFAAKLASCG